MLQGALNKEFLKSAWQIVGNLVKIRKVTRHKTTENI